MSPAAHRRLFGLATGVWFGFWVLGLPDYYRQYPASWMAIFDLALLPPICWWVQRVLKRSRSNRKTRLAAWMAFYFTVPLLLYDYAYCGLYLGEGLGFLGSYWYLTVYYAIPWAIFPLVGLWVDRCSAARESLRHAHTISPDLGPLP